MQLLRYILLASTIWTVPTFFLEIFGETVGSMSSHAMFVLFILYYVAVSKGRFLLPFLVLGLSYYLISGLVFVDVFEDYIYKVIKYVIFIVVGTEIAKRTNKKEIFIFLLIGGLSVLFNALFFPDDYGRYSGFYLNPNTAGVLALIGYGFSFMIKQKPLKSLGFIIFTLAGIITLSRYFLLMWIVLSFISLYFNRKNAIVFGFGFGALVFVLSISTILQLNTMRFSVVQSIFENQVSQGITFINENSRFDSWSKYYDMILEKPIFGNGYRALEGELGGTQGVHNTFLLTIGEAGIIPFFIMIWLYTLMLIRSVKKAKELPYILLIILALIGYMVVSHNYFDNYLILFVSLWVFLQFKNSISEESPIINYSSLLKD